MEGFVFGRHARGEVLHDCHLVERRRHRQMRKERRQIARHEQAVGRVMVIERTRAVVVAIGAERCAVPIPDRERETAGPPAGTAVRSPVGRVKVDRTWQAVEGEKDHFVSGRGSCLDFGISLNRAHRSVRSQKRFEHGSQSNTGSEGISHRVGTFSRAQILQAPSIFSLSSIAGLTRWSTLSARAILDALGRDRRCR